MAFSTSETLLIFCTAAGAATFAQAGRDAAQACSPTTDMRGSAEYKRHLASELTVRTLRTAVERVRNVPAVEGN